MFGSGITGCPRFRATVSRLRSSSTSCMNTLLDMFPRTETAIRSRVRDVLGKGRSISATIGGVTSSVGGSVRRCGLIGRWFRGT